MIDWLTSELPSTQSQLRSNPELMPFFYQKTKLWFSTNLDRYLSQYYFVTICIPRLTRCALCSHFFHHFKPSLSNYVLVQPKTSNFWLYLIGVKLFQNLRIIKISFVWKHEKKNWFQTKILLVFLINFNTNKYLYFFHVKNRFNQIKRNCEKRFNTKTTESVLYWSRLMFRWLTESWILPH